MKITLYGRVPSKKNSLRRIKRGNRIYTVPSENFSAWNGQQYLALKDCKPVEGIIWQVSLNFFMPCNRRTDLTNKAESVMDLLVDCEIIKDDSWQHIPQVLLNCEGVDKENPRVEIEIKCR